MGSSSETGPASAAPWRARLLLVLLLLSSFGLNAWMIDWGLPSTAGWAPDELLPSAVLEAKVRRFAGGWHDKYPPLHFRLLAGLYSRVLTADGAGVPPATYDRLFLLGRGLSVLMSVGVVLLVHLCGRRVMDEARGLTAAALVAVMAPFVFYSKLANVDVPYLFWWALSLLFLLRALETHQLTDYLALGVTAALAMGTKDQAYGLYLLVPFLLVRARRERDRRQGKATGWLRAVLAPELLLAGVLGVVVLAAIHGAIGNWEGAIAHLRLITGPASRDFREFTNDLTGHAGLLVSTIRHTAFVMGVPAFAAALLGVALAVRRRDGKLLPLLVPALSYYLFFMSVALYCYDRFVLPLAILLAFFAADALGRMASQDRWGTMATAAVILYGLARAISVDVLMANDSRYAAEGWLKANAGERLVAAVGPPEYLPRLDGLRARTIGPATARLETVAPDFVVTNADYAERADAGSEEQALYRGLVAGTLGYQEVWRQRFRSPWLMIRSEDLADRPGQPLRSNLDKVNPEIRIYRRETGP